MPLAPLVVVEAARRQRELSPQMRRQIDRQPVARNGAEDVPCETAARPEP